MRLRKELVENLAGRYVEAQKLNDKELLRKVQLDIRANMLSLDECLYLDTLRSEVKGA
jgi:hypothetical protein